MQTTTVKPGDSVKVWLCNSMHDKGMFSATATAVADSNYGFLLQLPNGFRFAPNVWVNGRWTRTQSVRLAQQLKCNWVRIQDDPAFGTPATPNWQNA